MLTPPREFFFLKYFLRWLTVAKKKNSLIEKALVSLLEKYVWLTGCQFREPGCMPV
jgi:hypothetical protein